jgi:hypothetical protein
MGLMRKKLKQALGFNDGQLRYFTSSVGYKIGKRNIKIPRDVISV